MGLLTAAQKAAIAADPVYRQVWYIAVPSDSGGINFNLLAVHDDDGGPYRIIDPGTRETSAYNVSMQEPGNLSKALYRVVVDNSDGALYPGGSLQVVTDYDGNVTYTATAIECRLYHHVYVRVDGAWSPLSFFSYIGRVNDIAYDDDRKTATITSTAESAVALDTEQRLDDVVTFDVDASSVSGFAGGIRGGT